MFRASRTLSIALVVFGAACGRNSTKAADSSLNTDLSLAAQQRGTLDSLSPAERANALNAPGAVAAPRTASSTVSRPRTTSSTARRRTSSSGSSSSGSTTTSTTTSASGGETTVKHTKRDAAIGAAAGAVIGATTSRDKVKGGVIGAAVGGILGGVIGNNVDIKKKKP